MTPFAVYLGPPLLGAFIGYMTNYVAIRMLFRPLKPWRIFGIRIPLTPGVIPGKRHDLAKNIGAMVGSHLLTSADVSKALGEEGFCRELESVVNGRLDAIMQRDLGTVRTLIPKRFRSYFEVGVKVLRWRALKHLHTHLESPAFAHGLEETIQEHFQVLLQKDMQSLLGNDRREQLYQTLESVFASALQGEKTRQWLIEYLQQNIDALLERGVNLRDLLSDDLIELLGNLIDQESPKLLQKAGTILNEPEQQARIASAICQAIDNFIASLGPLGAMASGFLTPAVILEKVEAFLATKGDEISAWLQDESLQQKLAQILHEKLALLLDTPLKEHLNHLSPEKADSIKIEICQQIASAIQGENTIRAICSLLREALENQSERPMEEILQHLFGANAVARGGRWFSAEIIDLLRSSKVRRILDTIMIELVETNLLNRPIGALADLLPREVQTGAADYLLQQINALLIREVPGLVDSLNIQQIVTKKVDSLDLLRLENLLLSIMQEQFKYINLFGGLLGFLIGLANILFLTSF